MYPNVGDVSKSRSKSYPSSEIAIFEKKPLHAAKWEYDNWVHCGIYTAVPSDLTYLKLSWFNENRGSPE